MKGNNKIELNGATLIAMAQHYFDTVLFAKGQSPEVTEVTPSRNGTGAAILIKEKEEQQNET